MALNGTPEVSVVVPSHDRALRLRWLLNALQRQTVDPSRFEVIVAHDSQGPDTEELLRGHPLARAGVLRHVTLEPSSAPPGANRNAALKLARAPLVAFTDDDCRPPDNWLESVLEAAGRHQGAIVQGKTQADPDELALVHASPWSRTQRIMPPVPWAQCCNIVYPRELIERVGGFDEEMMTGEDTDLAMRVIASGAEYVGDPDMLTFHAVETPPLHRRLRGLWRWQHLPDLIGRYPQLRESLPLWIFWRERHVWLPFAVAGAVLSGRNRLWALLAIPWVFHAMPRHGQDVRGRTRSLIELPGRAAIDITEFAALAWGSIKYRRLFL